MRTKVTLTKNIGIKISTEQRRNTDSSRVMKENKAMTQEIRKMYNFCTNNMNIIWTILYPKTSKDFCHHIKFRKSKMNRRCSKKNLPLKISQYSQKSICIEVAFLIKIQAFMPASLLKRGSNTGVSLTKLQNF